MPRHDDHSVHPNTPNILEALRAKEPHTTEKPVTQPKHTSKGELKKLAKQYGFQTVEELLERYPHLNPQRKAKRR